MTIHSLPATPESVHTFFSSELAPVLTIEPGDRVRFSCLDADAGLEQFKDDYWERPRLVPSRSGPRGHALNGPVAVRGAEPGMALAVKVESLRPGPYGWTLAGRWPEDGVIHRWTIDADNLTATSDAGFEVSLAPFMGVMGVTPAGPGPHSTTPPRAQGGNLDCKELGVGTTLYLPIAVSGGLFSVGDGHAVQGDGEVSGMALECAMEAELSFDVVPMRLSMPRAYGAAGWIAFGLDPDLDVAQRLALDNMLDLLVEQFQVSRADALALASVAVDLRVTQIVNRTQGVHAVLPHGAIRRRPPARSEAAGDGS